MDVELHVLMTPQPVEVGLKPMKSRGSVEGLWNTVAEAPGAAGHHNGLQGSASVDAVCTAI